MPPRPLVIVGDEAFTEEEWERRQQHLARKREGSRARREQNAEYARRWRAKNRDWYNAYKREWMARYRAAHAPIGALHELTCDGNHKRARKNCRPIPVWTR